MLVLMACLFTVVWMPRLVEAIRDLVDKNIDKLRAEAKPLLDIG